MSEPTVFEQPSVLPPPLPEGGVPHVDVLPAAAGDEADPFVPSGSFDPGPMPPVRPAQVPDYFA